MPLPNRAESATARVDALLTPRRVRLYPLVVLGVTVVGILIFLASSHPPFDPTGKPLFVDFSAQTTAGRIVLDGKVAQIYDVPLQRDVERSVLGPGTPTDYLNLFISPPFVAFLYAPFATLPYLVAATLWTLLSALLLLLGLRLLWPLAPPLTGWRFSLLALVVFSTQPVLELLADGQDAALLLLLLAGGLRLLMRRRDVAAGVVLGLGVFKPQVFLLLPLLLLCQRRWRALGAWAGTAGLLTAVSVLLVRPAGARSYVDLLTSDLYRKGISESLAWKMQSLTALGQFLLPPLAQPLTIALVALSSGAVLWWLARAATQGEAQSGERFPLLYAMTVLATALVDPHFFVYDCVILVLPAIVLLRRFPASAGVRISLAALYVITWSGPVRHALVETAPWPLTLFGAPWTPLPVLALFFIARRRLVSFEAYATPPPTVSLPGSLNATAGLPPRLGRDSLGAVPVEFSERSQRNDSGDQPRTGDASRDRRRAQAT